MERESVIVSDPEIVEGTPCFLGTRVPVLRKKIRKPLAYARGSETLSRVYGNLLCPDREGGFALGLFRRPAMP